MKKPILILVTCFMFISHVITAQVKENPLKGHYYSCNSAGYVETIFTDSLVYGIDTKIGPSHSNPYFILNEYQYVIFDTIEFYILDENKIVVKTIASNPYPSNDTLTRFDEKISHWHDYNCNTEMSLSDYHKKLDEEFIERWVKHGFECEEEKKLDDPNSGELIIPDSIEFDLLDKLAKRSENSKVVNFTYNEVKINTNPPYKNKIKQLVYNDDKTNLKLQIDFYFPCHIQYNFFDRINEGEILNIHYFKSRWFDLECENQCKAVLNYEIALKDSRISKIMLDDEELDLN